MMDSEVKYASADFDELAITKVRNVAVDWVYDSDMGKQPIWTTDQTQYPTIVFIRKDRIAQLFAVALRYGISSLSNLCSNLNNFIEDISKTATLRSFSISMLRLRRGRSCEFNVG